MADRSRCSRPGSTPNLRRSGTGWRSWRWTDFTGDKTAAVEAIHHHGRGDGSLFMWWLWSGTSWTAAGNESRRRGWGIGERSGDPLYGVRRVARTRAGLLTAKQQHRPAKVFTDQQHVGFEVTWGIYQGVIDAYQADQSAVGKKTMT